MVTGFPPFRSENRMELFESIVYKNPDLSKVFNILPRFLENYKICLKNFLLKSQTNV